MSDFVLTKAMVSQAIDAMSNWTEPDYLLELKQCDKSVGRLKVRDGRLCFEGEVDESARLFFDFLAEYAGVVRVK
jgi:hypothetical protein